MAARLGGLALEYVTERTRRGEFQGSTPRTVRTVLLSFCNDVGWDRRPMTVTRRHVERWMSDGGQAPSTLRNRLSVLRRFFDWLADGGILRRNPAAGLRGPRPPRAVPRGLRLEQVTGLLEGCPDRRARLVVLLMCQEGLRCREVAALEVGDVDVDERLMLVRGKGGHERVLPVSGETWQALVAYLGEHPAAAGPLIRSYSRPGHGLTPAHLSVRVGEWMGDAGVKVAPRDGRSAHALRHTAATDMLRAGAHVRDVQNALGHQSLATTQRYLPWLVGDLRQAMGGRTYAPGPGRDEAPPASAEGA